jgi:Ubiquitin carboxyl-terminal hydrolase, family 1
MIPKPVKAVVFLFPLSGSTETMRHAEDAVIESEGQPEVDPSVLYIKQTVMHLFPSFCARQGLFNQHLGRFQMRAGP